MNATVDGLSNLTYYGVDEWDQPFYVVRPPRTSSGAATTLFTHRAPLGEVLSVTDDLNRNTGYAYDAFGMLVASTGTPQGPFGFAGTSGYQEDGDTGLKLLGHRYYDPSTGRFLSRDPAKDGRNWYGYCDGNPKRGVDPEGLRTWINYLWEMPQAMLGLALNYWTQGGHSGTTSGSQTQPNMPAGDDTWHGASPIPWHVTLGPVMLHPSSDQKMDGPLATHEHNHQTQSAVLGPAYLPAIAASMAVGIVPGTWDWLTGNDHSLGGLQNAIHHASPMEVAAGPGG